MVKKKKNYMKYGDGAHRYQGAQKHHKSRKKPGGGKKGKSGY